VASEIIGGYRLQNLLMTGQTSQVWEVVEVISHRHFAMKLLLPERAREGEHRRMLFHEAEVGKQLAHPNIIRILTVMRDKVNPCFVMEFFPSGSVKLRMMRKQTDFIKEQAHSILRQTATALAFMNAKGWVHRDVKPDNILCNSAGDVRIIDFALAQRIPTGLAKLFRRRRGKGAGTRSYMSPEQIRGEALDGRSDIYSFGATAYEISTGRPPFRGQTAQDLLNKHIIEKATSPKIYNPDVTDEFAALVLHMLAKKREDRPKDFHQVLMKLRNVRVFKSEPAKATENA
jgi:serine/threonine-protein kinase